MGKLAKNTIKLHHKKNQSGRGIVYGGGTMEAASAAAAAATADADRLEASERVEAARVATAAKEEED
jgi:hypothetical protein